MQRKLLSVGGYVERSIDVLTYHSVNTILRLPSLVKFGPRVEECLETLATSSYAAPSDKWLCGTVGLARIAEEVSAAFEMDDPGADLKFTDQRIQFQLKVFQKQMRQWEKTINVSIDPRKSPDVVRIACVS